MSNKTTINANPENLDLHKKLIEKFGEKEFAAAKERAEFKIEMANAMKQRRIKLHIDQSELARKIKTSQQQLSRYEVGINSPTLDRVYDLCKALNLELILREKDKKTELVHIK